MEGRCVHLSFEGEGFECLQAGRRGGGRGGGRGVRMYVGVTGRKIETEGDSRLTDNYERCIG